MKHKTRAQLEASRMAELDHSDCGPSPGFSHSTKGETWAAVTLMITSSHRMAHRDSNSVFFFFFYIIFILFER